MIKLQLDELMHKQGCSHYERTAISLRKAGLLLLHTKRLIECSDVFNRMKQEFYQDETVVSSW